MKANLNPAKGMRDITPYEKEIRDYVEGVIVNTYKQSGFELFETPVVENIENLTGSQGGENLMLIFKIQDHHRQKYQKFYFLSILLVLGNHLRLYYLKTGSHSERDS